MGLPLASKTLRRTVRPRYSLPSTRQPSLRARRVGWRQEDRSARAAPGGGAAVQGEQERPGEAAARHGRTEGGVEEGQRERLRYT